MNSWKKTVVVLVILFMYLLIGAFVFQALESTDEYDGKLYIIDVLKEFMWNNSCVDINDLDTLIKEVVMWNDPYLIRNENISEPEEMITQWDIVNAIFFSTTVITTIGYGNIAPTTPAGCVFCVIYAFFGIPLTALFLANIGDCFSNSWNAWNIWFVSYTTCWSKHATLTKVISTFVLILLAYILVILIPGLLFSKVENWGVGTAQYFCFITLTTIGFGDYVLSNTASTSNILRAVYKILSVVYILFGLSVLTLSFKQLLVIYQSKVRRRRVRGRVKRKTIVLNQNDMIMTRIDGPMIEEEDVEFEIDVHDDESFVVTKDAAAQTDF